MHMTIGSSTSRPTTISSLPPSTCCASSFLRSNDCKRLVIGELGDQATCPVMPMPSNTSSSMPMPASASIAPCSPPIDNHASYTPATSSTPSFGTTEKRQRNRKRKSPCSSMGMFRSLLSRMLLSARLQL